jgi:hypothetical protein
LDVFYKKCMSVLFIFILAKATYMKYISVIFIFILAKETYMKYTSCSSYFLLVLLLRSLNVLWLSQIFVAINIFGFPILMLHCK